MIFFTTKPKHYILIREQTLTHLTHAEQSNAYSRITSNHMSHIRIVVVIIVFAIWTEEHFRTAVPPRKNASRHEETPATHPPHKTHIRKQVHKVFLEQYQQKTRSKTGVFQAQEQQRAKRKKELRKELLDWLGNTVNPG